MHGAHPIVDNLGLKRIGNLQPAGKILVTVTINEISNPPMRDHKFKKTGNILIINGWTGFISCLLMMTIHWCMHL